MSERGPIIALMQSGYEIKKQFESIRGIPQLDSSNLGRRFLSDTGLMKCAHFFFYQFRRRRWEIMRSFAAAARALRDRD